jgi:hypothetical protein
MKTDWRKLAAALDPPIPEADAGKIVPVLDALEAAFRPVQLSIPANALMWTGPEAAE